MVVEDVDENPSIAPAGGRYALAAALEGGMAFGVAVDGPVERDATREVGRQAGGERAFDPVADDAADDQRRLMVGQYGVREKIHVPVAFRLVCDEQPQLVGNRQPFSGGGEKAWFAPDFDAFWSAVSILKPQLGDQKCILFQADLAFPCQPWGTPEESFFGGKKQSSPEWRKHRSLVAIVSFGMGHGFQDMSIFFTI